MQCFASSDRKKLQSIGISLYLKFLTILTLSMGGIHYHVFYSIPFGSLKIASHGLLFDKALMYVSMYFKFVIYITILAKNLKKIKVLLL